MGKNFCSAKATGERLLKGILLFGKAVRTYCPAEFLVNVSGS